MAATEGGRGIDTNQAFRRTAQGYRLGSGEAQFGDDPSCAFGKCQSRRCRAHRMGAANEQLAADRALQAVDATGYRRRGQGVTT
ncbi:hypothetical protein D3C84_1182180 [compost metagenome]